LKIVILKIAILKIHEIITQLDAADITFATRYSDGNERNAVIGRVLRTIRYGFLQRE